MKWNSKTDAIWHKPSEVCRAMYMQTPAILFIQHCKYPLRGPKEGSIDTGLASKNNREVTCPANTFYMYSQMPSRFHEILGELETLLWEKKLIQDQMQGEGLNAH